MESVGPSCRGEVTASVSALVPHGWDRMAGLVCGFGNRHASPPPARTVLVEQVHGRDLVVADGLEPGTATGESMRADALVVTRPGPLVAVKTADCVPVLLVAAEGRWAAAVHAGWRGTIAGVVERAVADASERGHAPSTLLAALGPSIGPCCYEVGEEVAGRFADAGLPVLCGGAKPHVDLRAVNRILLEAAGLPPAGIQACGPCTRCRADLYHSHRASPSRSGRQLSWIGWEARRHGTDPRLPG
jgi:YfiH family protein